MPLLFPRSHWPPTVCTPPPSHRCSRLQAPAGRYRAAGRGSTALSPWFWEWGGPLGDAFRSSGASRLTSLLGGSVLVLLAFDLMDKASWSSAVRCPPARVSDSPFFRTGGVSYCLCYSQTLVLLKSLTVTGWKAGHVPGCTLHSAQGEMAPAVPWTVVWLLGRRGGQCLAASSLHPSSQFSANKPI